MKRQAYFIAFYVFLFAGCESTNVCDEAYQHLASCLSPSGIPEVALNCDGESAQLAEQLQSMDCQSLEMMLSQGKASTGFDYQEFCQLYQSYFPIFCEEDNSNSNSDVYNQTDQNTQKTESESRDGSSTGFKYIWPTEGVLTLKYGQTIWGWFHRGIDIAGPLGRPIMAAAAGQVTFAGFSTEGYGMLIKLRHFDNSMTYYGHNDKLLVKVGDNVSQGQQIAEMGSTGNSTGPHVHFELHENGLGLVDPLAYLPPQDSTDQSPAQDAQERNDSLTEKILVDLSDRKVYLQNKSGSVFQTYPCAIGKPGWETPQGTFAITMMRKDPVYDDPTTQVVEKIPPGPNNPLGPRFIGFFQNAKGYYGFHGTPWPNTIGTAATLGCLRMYDQDVIEFFDLVALGTKVVIQP